MPTSDVSISITSSQANSPMNIPIVLRQPCRHDLKQQGPLRSPSLMISQSVTINLIPIAIRPKRVRRLLTEAGSRQPSRSYIYTDVVSLSGLDTDS